MECVVSARALSGLIERKELTNAQERLHSYIETSGLKVLDGDKDKFTTNGSTRAVLRQTSTSAAEQRDRDPVTKMLTAAFKAPDLTGALEGAVQQPVPLIGNDVTRTAKQRSSTGALTKPRGLGSGAVFDSGADWISSKLKAQNMRGTLKGTFELPQTDDIRIVDGVTIPKALNSTTAVNFVLTQEAGKMKPKDLKIAIDKARTERLKRTQVIYFVYMIYLGDLRKNISCILYFCI